VDPGRDIGPTHIHGITAADVVGAPRFAEVAGDLLARMEGAVFSSHNVRFDWTFLAAEFEEAGHPLPDMPKLCTLMLGQRLQPWLRSRKLATCCEALDIELTDAHSAVNDAKAAALLLAAYLNMARTNGMIELESLGCDPTTWPQALPSLQPCGRRHERGARLHIDAQAAYLARLVRRLDNDTSADPEVAGYLDVLDRAVEDRRVTAAEGEALYETAVGYGLSSEVVAAAHRRYIEGLAHAALADGVLTLREREDLSLVCRLLDVAEPVLDEALLVAPALEATPPPPPTGLAGSSVCFTGALSATLDGSPLTRSAAERLAVTAGLRVVGTVTRGTDFLVVADPDTMSGKARRARELGIRIVAEQVFWAWLGVPVR
jgi:DNA polymerase-3 subunit epsilon